jgi:hypothetical protein
LVIGSLKTKTGFGILEYQSMWKGIKALLQRRCFLEEETGIDCRENVENETLFMDNE